jgi:hypothetical protein
MLFQRPEKPVSYTMGRFQTADREMAKSKMGEEEACLNKKQKKKIQVGSRVLSERQKKIRSQFWTLKNR